MNLERGTGPGLEVYGRLQPGRSKAAALTELTSIAQRLEEAWPESNEGLRPLVKPYIHEFIGSQSPALLKTMLGAVFGVLLIACANVANLLLARAAVRSKEIAIRSTFGAVRSRLILQVLIEVTVWSLVGAVLGLGMASVGVSFFDDSVRGIDLPYWIEFKLDTEAFFFAFGAAFLASLLAGLVPALRLSGRRLNDSLEGQERGATSGRLSRFSRVLVAAEIALSLGLLAATALMIRGTLKLQEVDFAFQTEGIFTANLELLEQDYPEKEQRQLFYRQLEERLQGLPGAEAVAFASALPTVHPGNWYFAIEGESYSKTEDHPFTRQIVISSGFFDTFDVSTLEGRDLTLEDDEEHLPVAIVNRSFAKQYYGEESAVGRRIRFGTQDSERPWRTIVGVVPDLNVSGADDQQPAGVYLPLAQHNTNNVQIVARVSGDPLALASPIRAEISTLDPNLPIYEADSMAEVIRENTWTYGVFSKLFMAFGGVALFLAGVGLYALMAFSVTRRRREIGIRRAFGAEKGQILKLLFRQATVEMVLGLSIGLLLALALGKGLSRMLFQVSPSDPVALVSVVVIMVLVCALAVFVPARRAAHIEPADALNHE